MADRSMFSQKLGVEPQLTSKPPGLWEEIPGYLHDGCNECKLVITNFSMRQLMQETKAKPTLCISVVERFGGQDRAITPWWVVWDNESMAFLGFASVGYGDRDALTFRASPPMPDDLSARIDKHFASLTDPRRRKVTYPLINIVTIALLAEDELRDGLAPGKPLRRRSDQTCRQQGRVVLSFLSGCMKAQLVGQQVPTLLS